MLSIRMIHVAWSLLLASLFTPFAFGSHPCATCHPQQVEGYGRTGMGRAISRPVQQPAGSFRHPRSGTEFTISATNSGMSQRLERDGLSAEYPIEYVIGSGNAAFGYLVKMGNHLFQSPITYYTKRGVWDMAPGNEDYPHPDFDRPVKAECLWCHSGRPLPVGGTVNQYQDPIFAVESISCDRCHGPVERHLKNPSSATIVNPSQLPPIPRDSTCEQCHLGGTARILLPGRSFGDFQPGMELEEVWSVYTYDHTEESRRAGSFSVVSHAEQLALSRCSEVSGDKMWCGTCHDPHEKPAEPVSYYRQRCLSCHGQGLLARHSTPSDDCVACHMARGQAYDSGHSAFTDHLISRRPQTRQKTPPLQKLRAWRKLPGWLDQRNLGLAYVQVGERDRSAYHLTEGFRLLAEMGASLPQDAEVLSAMGMVLMRGDRQRLPDLPRRALRLFQRAVREQPGYALHYQAVAAAWWALKSWEKAIASLERAIALDPLLESSYRMLAKIYQENNQPQLARKTWERYLQRMPQSIAARQSLRALKVKESLSP